jgi:hypothetical protein
MATPRRIRLHVRFGNPQEFNSELAAHDLQLGNVLDRLDNPLGQTWPGREVLEGTAGIWLAYSAETVSSGSGGRVN